MAVSIERTRRPRPMNIYVSRGSRAEDKYRALGGVPGLEPEVIVPGVPPTPSHDLLFHGGKTIPNLTFTNFYIGGDTWPQSDIQNIDRALAAAMGDPSLNNVMAQYFSGTPTSVFGPSQKLPGPAPARVSQGDVERLMSDLSGQGKLAGFDLSSTVFNLILPRGTILNDNAQPGGTQGVPQAESRRPGVPHEEEADSLHGLGGYHGSVQIRGTTVYYAVGVYSEVSGGQANGIPVFGHAFPAGGGPVVGQGLHDPLIDQRQALSGNAFGVEGDPPLRRMENVVTDRDVVTEELLAHAAREE